ncbi:unnamed protein product, partial [Adineta steineri]
MTDEHDEHGIERNRINGSYDLKLEDFACALCKKILWKPVVCKNCSTPFCSACIADRSDEQSKQCVNGCEEFVESKCPRFILQQLGRLNIACANHQYGCTEIIAYEALEAHETECGYQQQSCRGCEKVLPKKDLVDHENKCDLFDLTCSECNMNFKRRDTDLLHTEFKCLKEQFRQLRNQFETNKNATSQQIQHLSSIHQQLREEYEAYKQLAEEQVKQIIIKNYEFQEKFEPNNKPTNERINQIEQSVQSCKQGSDGKIQDLIETLE